MSSKLLALLQRFRPNEKLVLAPERAPGEDRRFLSAVFMQDDHALVGVSAVPGDLASFERLTIDMLEKRVGTIEEENETDTITEDDSDPANVFLRAGYLRGLAGGATGEDRVFLMRASRSLRAFAEQLKDKA